MLTIRKNGVIIDQAIDNGDYIANYEDEKDKPKTLFVLTEADREQRQQLSKD